MLTFLTNHPALRQFLSKYSMLLIFVAMFTIAAIWVDYFFTTDNLLGLLLSVSQVGLVAISMMFCLASRDFDLSVGSMVAFAGVLCATIINHSGSIFLAVSLTLLAGALIGGISGSIIAYLRINALITTLAMMQIVRGLAFIASGGNAVGISDDSFFNLASATFLGISMPIYIMAACFIIGGILLNNTVFGRNVIAIGSNPQAARLAGIRVQRLRVLIFLGQGALAALAGVILSARITSGQPNAGFGFELDVISACVLGGVSLAGGRATISGVLVGVLIMGMVQNCLDLLHVDTFYQYLVRGTILLLAVFFDQLKNRSAEG